MSESKGKAEGQENAPNFVHDLVLEDVQTGKHGGQVVTLSLIHI